LGTLGGVILVGYLIVYVRPSIALVCNRAYPGGLYLSLFFEQLIANLSESRWLNVLCIEFVIMTLCTVAIARSLLDERLQRALAALVRSRSRFMLPTAESSGPPQSLDGL